MRKKLLSIITLLCLTVTSAWADVGDSFTVDGILYVVTSESPKEVQLNTREYDPTEIIIPATVTNTDNSSDYKVTSIDIGVFYYCESLTSVTFASGSFVKTIGDQAFEDCTNLTSITIPASVTTIGESAFRECTGLTSITIGSGVETIGDFAFQDCTGLTSVTFDGVSSLTSIGESAFNSCTLLTSITIPSNVTSIGNDAFRYSGLTSIEIPDNVTSIGTYAFSSTGLTSITIGSGVETIGDYAFQECTYLTSVTFASGSQLTTIGEEAFSGCNNAGLTSITIPASVTTIGDNAFRECTGLTSVTVYAPSCTLGTDAFSYCTNMANIYVFSDLVGVFKSTDGWKDYEDNIQELPYPNGSCGATDVNDGKDVRWVLTGTSPDYTLTIMKTGATGAMTNYSGSHDQPWYSNKENITSVVIEDGVTSIGNYAFDGFTAIASVTVPTSVTSIGYGAFYGCSSLATYSGGSGVTNIESSAFQGCGSLTSFTIPSGVTVIKAYAFRQSGLTSITIPASVTTIGDNAFRDCTGLTSITIGKGVTSIENNPFQGCKTLSAITVNGDNPNYKDIEGVLFSNNGETLIAYPNGKGTTYTIPDGVTSIGRDAFNGCSDLTSMTIPDGVTSIGESAFNSCTGLTSVTIPASVTSIGQQAFLYCTGLTSVTFDGVSSLTSIGESAFSSCHNLASIKIPASVASIGGRAFSGCTGLTSVTVYAPSCTLGKYAFNHCNSLANIYVPAGSMETYKNMTNWSDYESKFVGMLSETDGITSTIATDIAGKPVSFTRTFSAGVASTVCLPFAMTGLAENTVYEMTSMDKSGDTWTATMTNVTSTVAGKPYLIKTAGEKQFSGTVANDFNGTAGTSSATYNGDGSWTFRGTYTTLTYGTNLDGAVYGFAGAAYSSISPGDFVKAEAGAYIPPFRCYLTYNAPSSARPLKRGADVDIELPNRIIVRLVSSNGQTTDIGSMDTKTGEVSFDSDAWYSLDGRKLNGKPTKKGMYINNGRKMIIK